MESATNLDDISSVWALDPELLRALEECLNSREAARPFSLPHARLETTPAAPAPGDNDYTRQVGVVRQITTSHNNNNTRAQEGATISRHFNIRLVVLHCN